MSISWSDILSVPAGEVPAEALDALRADGWEVSSTGIAPSFRQGWTPWHSLREFVQNTLDETGELDIAVLRDGGRVATIVSDDGRGFAVQSLLLGERKAATPQDIACLRGRFGEGMKIGVLPILRAGGRIFIRTAGLDVAFILSETQLAGQRVKALLLLTRANTVGRGTTVALEGLNAENYEGQDLRLRFTPALVAVRPSDVFHTVRGGAPADCAVRQVLRRPGEIYVRDIYVETRDRMLWGYNFWFKDSTAALDPNRDHLKESATSTGMNDEFDIILASMSSGTLKAYLASFRGQEESFEWDAVGDAVSYRLRTNPEFLRNLHAALVEAEGADRFSWAESQDDKRALEHLDVRDLSDLYPKGFLDPLATAGLVRRPAEIRKAVGAKYAVIEDADVKAFLDRFATGSDTDAATFAAYKKQAVAAYRGLLRRLRQLASSVANPDAKLFIYVGAGDGEDERIGGFAEIDAKRIFLRVSGIKQKTIIATFLHEAAHIASGATDLTDAFEHALVDAGMRFADIAARQRAWVASLKEEIETVRSIYFAFSFGDRMMALPQAIDEHGFEFFSAKPKRRA